MFGKMSQRLRNFLDSKKTFVHVSGTATRDEIETLIRKIELGQIKTRPLSALIDNTDKIKNKEAITTYLAQVDQAITNSEAVQRLLADKECIIKEKELEIT